MQNKKPVTQATGLFWSRLWDSNPQPADYKSAALPIELSRQNEFTKYNLMATRMRLELTTSSVTGWRSNQLNYRAKSCGDPSQTRTADTLIKSQVLYHLS